MNALLGSKMKFRMASSSLTSVIGIARGGAPAAMAQLECRHPGRIFFVQCFAHTTAATGATTAEAGHPHPWGHALLVPARWRED